jgi:polysaccharide biosynthesis/export protein
MGRFGQLKNLPIVWRMDMLVRLKKLVSSCLIVLVLSPAGCVHDHHKFSDPTLPHELAKVDLPEYVISPPDILKIDALQLVPLPPYKVQSLDILLIRVLKTLPEEPISGPFSVEPEGTVNLGLSYGKVSIVGMTIDEAKKTLENHLKKVLKEPIVDISILQGRGVQQIRGEHLVRPDGSVSLGSYGSVKVSGMNLREAKVMIEAQLKNYLQNPEVTVDVLAYNSKVYYIIFDQGGQGQTLFRLPITGSETVLDAFSNAQVRGLSVVANPHKIWLSRPAQDDNGPTKLPIDWRGITLKGESETNYQLFPGDRLYVQAYSAVTFNNFLTRVLTPINQLFGFSLLGQSVIQALKFPGNGGNGGLNNNTIP